MDLSHLDHHCGRGWLLLCITDVVYVKQPIIAVLHGILLRIEWEQTVTSYMPRRSLFCLPQLLESGPEVDCRLLMTSSALTTTSWKYLQVPKIPERPMFQQCSLELFVYCSFFDQSSGPICRKDSPVLGLGELRLLELSLFPPTLSIAPRRTSTGT
jgi:hypothetical protein